MKTLKNLFTSVLLLSLLSSTQNFTNAQIRFDDVPIYRIQLKVKTNNIENAATDSPVWIKFKSGEAPYFLNNSGDDREKSKVDVYDIIAPYIQKIRDIQMIHIEIDGTDGWNLTEVELLVNNVTFFKKTYGNGGQWLDRNNKKYRQSLAFNQNTIRNNNPYFGFERTNVSGGTNRNIQIMQPPTMIKAEMIKSLIEGTVGNALYYVRNVSWGKKYGSDYITVKKKDSNTFTVDLDLKYELDNMPDAEFDVDFDIQFICENGVIRTYITDYKSEIRGATKKFTGGIHALKSVMLAQCDSRPVPGEKYSCMYGLSMINKALDFSIFNEDNPNNTSACGTGTRIDEYGNLLLGAKATAMKKGKVTRFTSFTGKVNKTMMVGAVQKKK
jgi:hypothetical protein